MNVRSKLRAGFTIIELLIVISITSIILTTSVPLYTGFLKSAQLNDGAVQIVQTLRMAEQRSVSRYQKQSHGVKFETNRYTLYMGSSYINRQDGYDKTIMLDSSLSLSSTLTDGDVNFAMGTGMPNSKGLVTLIHATGDNKQILINEIGMIESD